MPKPPVLSKADRETLDKAFKEDAKTQARYKKQFGAVRLAAIDVAQDVAVETIKSLFTKKELAHVKLTVEVKLKDGATYGHVVMAVDVPMRLPKFILNEKALTTAGKRKIRKVLAKGGTML